MSADASREGGVLAAGTSAFRAVALVVDANHLVEQNADAFDFHLDHFTRVHGFRLTPGFR